MILATKRLILRPWNLTDAESLYKYASDPQVGPVAGWRPHESVEESESVIKNILSAPETYAVTLKETGEAIGSIGLKFGENTDFTDRNDECEIGYWLGTPYWGKGLMTEAVKEILRHAFEDLALSKVWAGYYDGNERSRRVQEKCGLKYQWTTKDLFVPQLNETRVGHATCISASEWKILSDKK